MDKKAQLYVDLWERLWQKQLQRPATFLASFHKILEDQCEQPSRDEE